LGRKVHPFGFRIGVIRDWQSKWYADKDYIESLQEDLKIRRAIDAGYAEASVSLVEIDRQANKVAVTIYTARPGVVIGRGGQRVDEMRANLEEIIGKKVQLNIQEVQQPELDAFLVARSVADQMEHRVAFRRAMKQALFRTMQAGAKGMRISCSGRLGGNEIARREVLHQGQVPLHTMRADIDYGFTEARTTLGRIGVKVWIYKGDILPESVKIEAEETAEEAPPEPAPPKSAAKPARAKVAVETEPAEEPPAEAAEAAPAEKTPAEPEAAKSEAAEEKPAKPAKAKSAEAEPVKKKPAKPAKAKAAAKPAKAKSAPVEKKPAKAKAPSAELKSAEAATEAEPEEKDATT
jgi:small subunit ribosomal protein S3